MKMVDASLTMTDDVAPPRLDMWLTRERGITRHAAQTMIAAGLVTVNGRLAKASQRVRARDDVQVTDEWAGNETRQGLTGRHGGEPNSVGARSEPSVEPRSAPSTPRPPGPIRQSAPTAYPEGPDTSRPALAPVVNIVYEDEWLAVVDKPAGLVVHPAAGHHGDTLVDALLARGTAWSLLGGAERAGIVHRLDRDTSGLLVVAKTESAHRVLAAQLRDRTLGRTYWAMVHGGFREDTGTIEAPIGRDPRDRKRMAVVDSGREAVTDFRVVERLGDETVLEVTLRTGRTHQIRVHLAYIGHPVTGDAVYGRAERRLGRPALHAMRLTFAHPDDGGTRVYESPIPPDLLAFRDNLRDKRT
jgi:23S rRNA pseudouridine1911/1915/1917 synthase